MAKLKMMEKALEKLHEEAEQDFIESHKILTDSWIDPYCTLITQTQTGYDEDLVQVMQDKLRRLHALAYRRRSSANEINRAMLNTLIHMADAVANAVKPHALARAFVNGEVETLLYLLADGERMSEVAIRGELDLPEPQLQRGFNTALTHGVLVRTYGAGVLYNITGAGQLVLHHLKHFRRGQGKR